MQQFSHYPAWPPPVDVPLMTVEDHPCVYLPGRLSRSRAFWAERISPAGYQALMDAGFRRSGRLIYQPVCSGCRQCAPIRVLVEQFRRNKSQRRCNKRNSDLQLVITEPHATDEKYDLYRRYLHGWHGDGSGDDTREGFERFLYDSPVETLEFSYRDRSGRLLAVGICDICPTALSSVYHWFDPAQARRGLGTFGVLCEVSFAQSCRLGYYYLGYWVSGCRGMRYKSEFRPYQLLDSDGIWRGAAQSHTCGIGQSE